MASRPLGRLAEDQSLSEVTTVRLPPRQSALGYMFNVLCSWWCVGIVAYSVSKAVTSWWAQAQTRLG
jgi:hypothetical protein